MGTEFIVSGIIIWLFLCFPGVLVMTAVLDSGALDELTIIGKIIVWVSLSPILAPALSMILMLILFKLLIYPLYLLMVKKRSKVSFWEYMKIGAADGDDYIAEW